MLSDNQVLVLKWCYGFLVWGLAAYLATNSLLAIYISLIPGFAMFLYALQQLVIETYEVISSLVREL